MDGGILKVGSRCNDYSFRACHELSDPACVKDIADCKPAP
jgi:hypothetical protein